MPSTGNGRRPVTDGYYLSALFVHTPTQTVQWSLADGLAALRCPSVPWTGPIQPPRLASGLLAGWYRARTCTFANLLQLEIRVFANPQIQNQVLFQYLPGTYTGMMADRFRPKLFNVKLQETEPIVLPPGKRVTCHKTTIVHQREDLHSILWPMVFGDP